MTWDDGFEMLVSADLIHTVLLISRAAMNLRPFAQVLLINVVSPLCFPSVDGIRQ
jgi:hypothetical protein